MAVSKNFRYAARQLCKSPAFTVTVLATLGLCIGANTAIFSIADQIFFRPLPYPQPDRLMMLVQVQTKNGASYLQEGQTGLDFELARDHASLLDIAAGERASTGVNLFARGRVEYVNQEKVSANFFRVIGVHPLIGREFTRDEDVPGGPALAILSYGIWQRIFGGDPSIVGRAIDLHGQPYTVTGVMPKGFRTDFPTDVWIPLHPTRAGEGGGMNYFVIARLKPGATIAQANAQLDAVMTPALKQFRPTPDITVQEHVVPLQVGWADEADLRTKISLMWAASGLVLIIGCVNIAGILLARSTTRSREIATRAALGASRRAIVSQLLHEAILLGLGAGVVGLVIGKLALVGLTRLSQGEFEVWGPVQLDLRVGAIMLALAFATGIFFGLYPAIEAASLDLRAALVEGTRGSSGGQRRRWARQIIVVTEIALGVVLVVSAGLLIRTLSTLMNLNPGFNPDHVLTASLSLDDVRYKTTASGLRLFRETLDRIREIPGVESAAVTLNLPYTQQLNLNIQRVAGRAIDVNNSIVNFNWATPGLFHVLQIPLLQGRLFTDADNATSRHVAVVNDAFIRYFLRGERDPIGRDVALWGGGTFQIIGVVHGVQQLNGFGGSYGGPLVPLPQMYIPAAQVPDDLFAGANSWFAISYVVRTRANIPGLADSMRRLLEAADPHLTFSAFHSMSDIRRDAANQQRYQATLFSALAGLAVLLAALGVYGLVAQSVAQRTREMGIRLALGATVQNIIRTAAAPGIALSLAGIACGLMLCVFATRLLKSLLWGVAPTDAVTFAAVAALLMIIALAASAIPALRLAHLDPSQTLRHE